MDERILSWRQRLTLWYRLTLRIAIFAIVILALSMWLPSLLSAFLPFVLAFLFAWALNPPIRFLHRKFGIPRKPLSLVFLLLIFGLLLFLVGRIVYALAGEVVSFTQNWDFLSQTLMGYLNMFEEWVSSLSPEIGLQIERLIAIFFEWLQDVVTTLLNSAGLYNSAGNFIKSVPNFFVAFVIFFMGSYFMSADFPSIRFAASKGLPENLRSFLSGIKNIISAAFGGYVRAEFLLSVGVFIILWVGFLVTGQNYAILLALAFAVLDFIPIIGAGTIMVPWALIDLINGKYQHALGLMVIWGIIALFRRIAEPKVLGDQTGLHPIVSLFAIFLGMKMGGILGMVLGPVLLLTVINVCKSGVFDGFIADVKMAVDDVYTTLKDRPDSMDY